MPNKSAVFIITHARATSMATLNTLEKNNCTLPIYLVVDDLDPQLEDYKKRYGEIVKVFSKLAIYSKVDTIDNFKEMTSAVYARYYVQQLAEGMGLDFYVMMDDDIQEFNARFIDNNGVNKSYNIKNVTPIFEEAFDLLDKTRLSAVGFGLGNSYYGGIAKEWENTVFCVFCIKTSKAPVFKGTRTDDAVANHCANVQGTPMISNRHLSFRSPVRGEEDGGLKDDYDKVGMFVSNFYPMIASPSTQVITGSGSTKKIPNCYPKILNERWKQ